MGECWEVAEYDVAWSDVLSRVFKTSYSEARAQLEEWVREAREAGWDCVETMGGDVYVCHHPDYGEREYGLFEAPEYYCKEKSPWL